MPAILLTLCDSEMTTARPCHEDGEFLQDPLVLLTLCEEDHVHNWMPFEDCLTFDWSYYHYMTLQSSAANIAEGLNLWSATSIKYSSLDGTLWKSVKEMYVTIDAIQTGALPFKTYSISYSGPKPSTPPHWMEQTYKLNAHNVLAVA